MDWRDTCIRRLDAERMFESADHRTRFCELMDCYSGYPFFTRGLCKCVWLSCWDEEHFLIMLETLTDLSLGKETNTGEMRIKGDALMEEQTDAQQYVYELSNAFLDDAPYSLDDSLDLPEDIRYIIMRALHASVVIDNA